MRTIDLIVTSVLTLLSLQAFSQCFTDGQPATATFATGGTSSYKKDILWLTWGGTSGGAYGTHDQGLRDGAISRASIGIGDGSFLCLEATISQLNGTSDDHGNIIKSYAPGNYKGDSLDDMYHIGGIGEANELVCGIRNAANAGWASFTITCRATLDGQAVKLPGMVLADAESLAPGENFYVIADGKWTIIDLKKNLKEKIGSYEVQKSITKGTMQKMHFVKGNDEETGAVAVLSFNPSAYAEEDYAVKFDVYLKGGGLTALALGVIPTSIDGGDAPATYGVPLHIIDGKQATDDKIKVGGTTINLNTKEYEPGKLVNPIMGYLGSTFPDADTQPLHSKDALGDDNNPIADTKEEDAWPIEYKRFSYKKYYNPLQELIVDIPYRGDKDGYVYGWIDFNLNGKFDDDEIAYGKALASKSSAQLRWIVPSDRVIESTYVRLRYVYDTDLLREDQSPTGVVTGGEVEDHRIQILGPTFINPRIPSKARR